MKKQRVIFKSHDKIECIINGVKVRGEVLVGIARRNNKKRSPANIKFYVICNDKMSNAGMWSKDMNLEATSKALFLGYTSAYITVDPHLYGAKLLKK